MDIRLVSENDRFAIYLTKDQKLNTVNFKITSIVGEYANGEPLEEDTAFYGHFGYDLCIHLRMKEIDCGYYHHFCNGTDINMLGTLLQTSQDRLKNGLIPEYKPLR